MHAESSRMLQKHAGPWACKQLHKLACSYMSLHAVPWTFMKFNELTWISMSLHAVSWACIQFLSLSEQLTRISQCLFNINSYSLKIYLLCYQACHWFYLVWLDTAGRLEHLPTEDYACPCRTFRSQRYQICAEAFLSVFWIRRCLLDEGQGGVGRQTLADNGQSDHVELGDLRLHIAVLAALFWWPSWGNTE